MSHTTARAVSNHAMAEVDVDAVLDGLADAIIVADQSGRIRYVNISAAELLGWRPEELTGEPITSIQPRRMQEACADGMRRYLQTGESRWTGKTLRLPAVRRDGTEIEIDLTLTTLPAYDDETSELFVATMRRPASPIMVERRLDAVVPETIIPRSAEAAERHSEFLFEASTVLSSSLSVEDTLANLVNLAVPRLADWSFVDVVGEDGQVRPGPVACEDPITADALRALRERYPTDWESPRPQGYALRSRESLLLPEMSGDWLAANFEDAELVRHIRRLHVASGMVVPMIARDRTLGVMSFAAMAHRPPYDSGDLALAQEVVGRAALAIANARLYESQQHARAEAEASAARSRFLAEASIRLSGALDEPTLLQRLTTLVVPDLADWCVFDVIAEDGVARRWVGSHGGPGNDALARELEERFPLDLSAERNIVVSVIRSGEPSLLSTTPDDVMKTAARDDRHLEILRSLGIQSNIIVPLIARGQTIGALTFISAQVERRYDQGDLELASDLARRVALAIDNARLFQEQIRARARIQELAAERNAVLGQIADGVIITDPHGRIVFVNEAAARLHGVATLDVSVDQYAKTYHLFTLDGQPYPPEELPLARAVLTGETTMNGVWRIRRPDDTEIIAQGSAAPVLTDEGARLGAVLTLRDVTAQHEFERSKEDFIATASHDLRTPLTTIKGWAQLLRQRLPAGPNADRSIAALTAIEAQANAMQRLIEQLLVASRLQLGEDQPLQPQSVDASELATRLVVEFQALTDRHELRISAPETPTIVGHWDPDRVEQIIGNLLSNAVKYSPAGGTIEVIVESDQRQVRLTVVDQGLGIPEADRLRIFDRYYRVARHAQEGIAGTGLGLFSAQHLAQRMGGRIDVESEEGVGSAFTLVLPLQPGPTTGNEST